MKTKVHNHQSVIIQNKRLKRVYNSFLIVENTSKIKHPRYPLSAAKLHLSHLHQQHLLSCTAYTIIAKHTQIG